MNDWPELVPLALGELQTLRLRFVMEAAGDARLPEYVGSTLRGALAMSFRRMVCTYGKRSCDGCPAQRTCSYPGLFETPESTGAQAIRRLRDIPHPIVIEPPARHPIQYREGARFDFGVVLIGKAISALPYLIFAVNEMGAIGLGVRRSLFRLLSVEDRLGVSIFDSQTGIVNGRGKITSIRELWEQHPYSSRLRIAFETPLRIKQDQKLVSKSFDVSTFFRQSCRRLWELVLHHSQSKANELDFRPLLERIPIPRVEKTGLRWKELERYSNRQKTKLKMGGICGQFELLDVKKEWAPILTAVSELHAGKGTIMGLGKVRVECMVEDARENASRLNEKIVELHR